MVCGGGYSPSHPHTLSLTLTITPRVAVDVLDEHNERADRRVHVFEAVLKLGTVGIGVVLMNMTLSPGDGHHGRCNEVGTYSRVCTRSSSGTEPAFKPRNHRVTAA